ncbi:hypothetical protein Aperf_G00000030365 [Anoplocephala perfoliata]
MVGLYPNGNNQIPDTTSTAQDIHMPAPLIDPGGGGSGGSSSSNSDNVSNSQQQAQAYSGLDEFSLAPPTDYCGGIPTASIFQQGDYVPYHQAMCFRPFEAEGFGSAVGEMAMINSCCYAGGSSLENANQTERLGSLFKSVTFQASDVKPSSSPSMRSLNQNIFCEQDDFQKTLPSLPFNPIYPTLCLPTSQRLPFEPSAQQIHLEAPMIHDPLSQQQPLHSQAIPAFQTSNKFRSQSGLMELLGTRTMKSSTISPKSEIEVKPPKRDENVTASTDNNAVPRSSYMCRKCRAHGRLIAVRQHKRNCPYKHCSCSVCSLVNYGRHIVARQIALYRDQKNHPSEESGSSGRARGGGGKSLGAEKFDTEDEGPHCRRCRNHGKTNPWKGHKKVCPFYYCICQQCILITLRKSNEKNLREVVQESHKEMGLRTPKKHSATEEINFPAPLYNKKAVKLGQEKQTFNREQEIPSAYQDNYTLSWRNQEEANVEATENDTRFLPAGFPNTQQENGFYNTRAHQAAAFAAAAAAAVAIQQENAISSVDSAIPLKEESLTDCATQSIAQADYLVRDSWACDGEIKCTLSVKDINGSQLEGFSDHNGFSSFWQEALSLSTCREATGPLLESCGPNMIGSHDQVMSNKVDNIT